MLRPPYPAVEESQADIWLAVELDPQNRSAQNGE